MAAHCWGEITPQKKLEIGEKLEKVWGDDCDEDLKRFNISEMVETRCNRDRSQEDARGSIAQNC